LQSCVGASIITFKSETDTTGYGQQQGPTRTRPTIVAEHGRQTRHKSNGTTVRNAHCSAGANNNTPVDTSSYWIGVEQCREHVHGMFTHAFISSAYLDAIGAHVSRSAVRSPCRPASIKHTIRTDTTCSGGYAHGHPTFNRLVDDGCGCIADCRHATSAAERAC
jgi:hypothetical protein